MSPVASPSTSAFPATPDPDERPRSLVVACVLTFVGAGSVALVAFVGLVLAAVEPGQVRRSMDAEISYETAVAVALTGLGVLLVLSLAAVVGAALTLRGRVTGRRILTVCCIATVLLSLPTLVSVWPVLTLVGASLTLVLAYTDPASDWIRGETL